MIRKILVFALAIVAAAAVVIHAQNLTPGGQTPVQPSQSAYFQTVLTSTAAVNNQVTLTIPAPIQAGFYNYVCSLKFVASQDATGSVQTNAVTTSTNFNAFAIKYSLLASANINYETTYNFGTPATGCVKSASPTTATTFVSPAGAMDIAFMWAASYYQAP